MIRKKLLLKQYMVASMSEGMIDMIADQSQEIGHLQPAVKKASAKVYRVLRKEGTLSTKDFEKLKKLVLATEKKHFSSGFAVMNGLSLLAEMITYQTVKCTGQKKNAFSWLLDSITAVINHFDPSHSSECDDCDNIVETLNTIEEKK